MRCGWCVGGTIPRSRDGVHATGRIRETSGSSKRVFYHLFAGFDRHVRGRAHTERAGSVDGIGFTHTPTRNGGSVVRWTSHRSFGRRDAYTRCATGRSESPEIVSIPFVAFRRRCSSRARSRPGRSIGRDAHVDALDDDVERDTGGRARGMENPRGIGIRTCGIGLAVHNSRMYPPSHEELVGNLECVDRSDG